MTRWRRLGRAPAVHFFVLGGLLFASQGWWPSRAPVRAPAPPLGDEELLLQEALALGLDRTDRFVRERLAGLVRVVDAGAVEDAPRLEREARRLGLERHDLVVRRHLVQAMELALAHGGPGEWPSDEVLAVYLERHAAQFTQPARLRFTHVFFARDRAGEPAATAAAAALTRLAAEPVRPAPGSLGDGFLSGPDRGDAEAEQAGVEAGDLRLDAREIRDVLQDELIELRVRLPGRAAADDDDAAHAGIEEALAEHPLADHAGGPEEQDVHGSSPARVIRSGPTAAAVS
jgi:hypothetical protein